MCVYCTSVVLGQYSFKNSDSIFKIIPKSHNNKNFKSKLIKVEC